MVKAVALSRSTWIAARERQAEVMSSAIAFASAAALIFADKALPF